MIPSFILFFSTNISSPKESIQKTSGPFSNTSLPVFKKELVINPLSSGNWDLDHTLETHLDTCCILLQVQNLPHTSTVNCLSVWIASQMQKCIYRYCQSWLAQQQLINYYYNKTQPILIIQSLVSMLKLDQNLTKSHFLRWWAWLTLVKLRGTCSKKWLFRLKFWTESVICCLKKTISLPATVSDKSINHFRSDNSDNYIIWI